MLTHDPAPCRWCLTVASVRQKRRAIRNSSDQSPTCELVEDIDTYTIPEPFAVNRQTHGAARGGVKAFWQACRGSHAVFECDVRRLVFRVGWIYFGEEFFILTPG